MSIRDQVNKDFIQARKEKDILKSNVLRLMKSYFDSYRIDQGKEIEENEVINYLLKEQKQTEEALKFAHDAKRADLIEENELKLVIIRNYLPQMMSEQEIREYLIEKGVPEMSMKDAMKLSMSELDGKAEKKVVSQVVKELLGK